MDLARFPDNALAANRPRAIGFIQQNTTPAQKQGDIARRSVTLTRGAHNAAPQFDVELTS